MSKVESTTEGSFCVAELAVHGVGAEQSFIVPPGAAAAAAGAGGVATPATTPSGTDVQYSAKAEGGGAQMDTGMNTEIKTEVGSYATVPPSVMASTASAAMGLGGGSAPAAQDAFATQLTIPLEGERPRSLSEQTVGAPMESTQSYATIPPRRGTPATVVSESLASDMPKASTAPVPCRPPGMPPMMPVQPLEPTALPVMTPSASMEGVTLEEIKNANISGVAPRVGLADPTPLFAQDVGRDESHAAVPKAASPAGPGSASGSAPTRAQVAKVREEVKKELEEENVANAKAALPQPKMGSASEARWGLRPCGFCFPRWSPNAICDELCGGGKACG